MRITRAGFTDEDFYGANYTDHVHFRYLHKLLRQVPNLTLSDTADGKFTQGVAQVAKSSKYGSNTYTATVTTMNADHTTSDHIVNPFIDDQLAQFYQLEVKPQIDRLDKLIADLTKVVDQQGQEISALQSTVHDQGETITTLQGTVKNQGDTITALEQRLAALEQPKAAN